MTTDPSEPLVDDDQYKVLADAHGILVRLPYIVRPLPTDDDQSGIYLRNMAHELGRFLALTSAPPGPDDTMIGPKSDLEQELVQGLRDVAANILSLANDLRERRA